MKIPCITSECPYGVGTKSNTGLCNNCYQAKYRRERYQKRKEAKPKQRTISEKDLELLQRYDNYSDEYGCHPRDDGEYVRWDALIQLLK